MQAFQVIPYALGIVDPRTVSTGGSVCGTETQVADGGDVSVPSTLANGFEHTPKTGTFLDFFTNNGNYMPRTHCLVGADGQPDWPWIALLVVTTTVVIAGYLRIFVFWRRAYLDEAPQDRNKKMMQLAYIFLFCAICGYAFALMMYVWPAYRLLACFMVALTVVTWKFAFSLKDFRVSLSANRLQRELQEELRDRNQQLERMVAERTRDLETIREQTKLLALVAAKTDNAVVITDLQGKVTWANRSYTRLSGANLDEILGQRPDYMDPDPETDSQSIVDIQKAIAGHMPLRTQIINRAKDGHTYWADLEIQPIRDDDGRVTHFMAIETDITESKALQDQLGRAKDEAEKANRAKSQFLANMSHEIRTPLTGIIGFAEMLEKAPNVTDEERCDWARTIRNSSKHLQHLLNDILDISKIEAGKLELETLPTALHPMLSDLASMFRAIAMGKGLRLELAAPNPLPETVVIDPTRVRQVLSNLINNAIKFTSVGTVRVEADMVDGKLRLDVVDTGPGISEADQKRLFQPFTQVDASVTRQFGGTGLGLVIARQLCQAMDGDLRLESRLGFGSRFIATIDPGHLEGVPLVVADEATTNMADAKVDNHSTVPTRSNGGVASTQDGKAKKVSANAMQWPQLVGKRVLVVDDGETNRKLIRLLLNNAGAEVAEACHGQEAVDRLAPENGDETAKQDVADVVLMDMQMPVLDGYQATVVLRERGIDLPIIALTASALKGDKERCLEAGCTAYLAKPIDAEGLYRAIAKAVGDRPTRANDAAVEQEAAGATKSVALAEAHDGLATDTKAITPLWSTLEDDDPGINELIESYVASLGGYLDELEQAIDQREHDQIAALAHKVVGSGTMLGFGPLAEPGEALEQAAMDGHADVAAECLQALRGLHAMIEAAHGQPNTPGEGRTSSQVGNGQDASRST